MDIDQDRIVFTGNIARFNPLYPQRSNQNQNIDWLRHIVSPHLQLLLRKPIDLVRWDADSEQSNDPYRFLGLEPDIENYLDIYLGRHNDRLDAFLTPLFDRCLVIGFEIPPFMIQFFNARGIPYIDVILGPLRFFPDLVPAVRSNSPPVAGALAELRLSEQEIALVASWRKAYFAKQKLESFAPDTILLLGQTSFDTSQVSDGRFVELAQFEREVSSIASGRKVLFKPHPYAMKKDRVSQARLMKKLGIPVTTDNVYYLFNCPGISEVVSISSSACVEAPYFDKKARMLIEYPFPFTPPGELETDSFYNIYDQLASTEFWARLLAVPADETYSLAPGALSQSLGQNWGASAFSVTAQASKKSVLAALLGR